MRGIERGNKQNWIDKGVTRNQETRILSPHTTLDLFAINVVVCPASAWD